MIEKNRRGLSTIIATLLIILLTLVSVGIIWVVIRNVVQSGTNQVDLSQRCLAVELSATTVNDTQQTLGFYYVTLHRGSDSQGDLGIKVVVFNGTNGTGLANNSGPRDFGSFGELKPIGTITKNVTTPWTAGPTPVLTNGDKIEFTAYFRDASGNDQLCSQTGELNF